MYPLAWGPIYFKWPANNVIGPTYVKTIYISPQGFDRSNALQNAKIQTKCKLYLPKNNPIVIGVCYRPPKHVDFFNTLEQCCLDCNSFTNKEIIMMGDFNIDNFQMHCHANQLHVSAKYFIAMFGMTQLINTSARILSTTSTTILYLTMISDPSKISQFGVLDLGLNDHQVIYCARKCKKLPML